MKTHAFPNPARRRTMQSLALLAALLATACNTDPGGSTDGEGVRLKGRVTGSGGSPVPGVVVTAARTGLSDTTDAMGRYLLSANVADTGTGEDVLDTLRFVKQGQPLARISVTHWIDELPDLQLIQRNIVGALDVGLSPMSRVEFVLSGDGVDSASPVVTPVYYNALAGNYSGFAYFAPSPSVQNYEVFINVYGADSTLLARSATVPFNSFAGDITIPTFASSNAYPAVNAGLNQTVRVASSVTLAGTASDGFGGSIVKWEWSINGGPFEERSSGDTVITAPSTRAANYPCALRVTDNEGHTSTGSLKLIVTNDGPVIAGLPDTLVVGLDASVNFAVTAMDSHAVARYIWDFDGNGVADDTTVTGTLTHVFPGTAGTGRVILTVEDSYDGVSRDTVLVFRLSHGLTWTTRSSGATRNLRAAAWTGSKFVAVGESLTVLTSSDGASWTQRSLTGGIRNLNAVAGSASQLVAIAERGSSPVGDSMVYASTNGGSDWTVQGDTSFYTRRPVKAIRAGGNYVVRIDPTGVMVSTDGLDWDYVNAMGSSVNRSGGDLTWDGTRYASLSESGKFVTSTDGFTWASQATTGLGTLSNFTGLIRAGDRYVVMAPQNVYQSADGIAWSLISSPRLPSSMFDVLWIDGMIVGVARDGSILMSPDKGENWLRRNPGTGALRAIAASAGRLVAVGDGGAIVTAD